MFVDGVFFMDLNQIVQVKGVVGLDERQYINRRKHVQTLGFTLPVMLEENYCVKF